MSESTTDNVPDEIESTHPVDFTIDDVPDEIQGIRLVGLLYVEILRAGNMTLTGNEIQDRANALKIKNHVAYWAYIHSEDATDERTTVRLSMNVVNPDASFGSTDARYAPSDRPSFDSAFSASSKLTSSYAPPSDEMSPDNVPPSVSSSDGLGVSSRSGSFSDAASISQLIAILPEGAPAPGRFDVKVRDYSGKSNSAVVSFALRIIGEPRVGDFLNSLRVRNMLPFFFTKKGFSYLGCRHFASEAVEAWKQDEYIMDRCKITGRYFRDLIGIRYTPLESLPANPSASSEDEGDEEEVITGMRKTTNPIDRGIFPVEFQPLTAGYPFSR